MVGSRIKISRPRHRKRQNYYSINPYTRDLARTSCGLSRRSPRKLQQREKREPCRSLPRTLFFFSGTAPWHRAHAPWDLVAILLSRVRSPLDIPRTLYISPISPLPSSPPSSSPPSFVFLFFLLSFPARPGTESHKSRGGGGLQIIWNFPFDAEESPRGSFSARDSQTNDRLAFADISGLHASSPSLDITLTPFAFPQSELLLMDFSLTGGTILLVFRNFENSLFSFLFFSCAWNVRKSRLINCCLTIYNWYDFWFLYFENIVKRSMTRGRECVFF